MRGAPKLGVGARALAGAGLALALALSGCGKGGGAGGAQGMSGKELALRGSYKVRAVENGRDLGIGLYDGGSFRLLPEGRLLVAIYDREAGESWIFDRSSRALRRVTREEAAAFDNFMPATLLEQYFQLERRRVPDGDR